MTLSIKNVDPTLLFLREEDLTRAKKLKEGITLSPETLKKLQKNFFNIRSNNPVDGVTIHRSNKNHCVFSLSTDPQLIFKTSRTEHLVHRETPLSEDSTPLPTPENKQNNNDAKMEMKNRYKQMIKAQEIIEQKNLDLLIIPKVSYYIIENQSCTFELIAEEKLSLEKEREKIRERCEEEIERLIIQLTHFICLSGFSDVAPRNIPLVIDGNLRRIALIDLEEMNDPVTGLVGIGHTRMGLLRCVHQTFHKKITEIAQLYHLDITEESEELKTEKKSPPTFNRSDWSIQSFNEPDIRSPMTRRQSSCTIFTP